MHVIAMLSTNMKSAINRLCQKALTLPRYLPRLIIAPIIKVPRQAYNLTNLYK